MLGCASTNVTTFMSSNESNPNMVRHKPTKQNAFLSQAFWDKDDKLNSASAKLLNDLLTSDKFTEGMTKTESAKIFKSLDSRMRKAIYKGEITQEIAKRIYSSIGWEYNPKGSMRRRR